MLALLRRLRARIKYRHFERDLREELDTHRALVERDLTTGGLPPADARWRAARRLGNDTLARETARQVWVVRWLDEVRQDVRYAIRGLIRTPGVSVAALAVLVAALGLNTSLFTAFRAVLLRPWPVAAPSEVVSAFAAKATAPTDYGGWPLAEYRYLRELATQVDLVAMRDARVTFDYQAAGAGSSVRIASDNYFSTLGVRLQLGRGFESGDDDPARPRAVVVLSDRTWREGYGARPSVVGDTIRLDNVPFMVIGVAAPGALDNPLDPFPSAWLPWASLPLLSGAKSSMDLLTSPAACCQDVAGRLRAGATAPTAEAELTGLSQRYRADHGVRFVGVRVTGTALMDTPRAGTATPIFGLLFAGVLLLLALACANVGNLVLARSMARTNEVRVRLSLGAGRARLVRQCLTESLTLSALAAAASIPLAYWLPSEILGRVSPLLAFGLDLRPDPAVWAFVAVLVVASALLFGLAPAFRVTGAAIRLATGSRLAGDRGTARLRLGLLAGQIAISSVLLVASVLLGRAVLRQSMVPLGFDAGGLTVATVWLPANAYDSARAEAFSHALLTTVGGEGRIAATAAAPFASRPSVRVRRPEASPEEAFEIAWESVSPSFFDVVGIPLVAGRAITGPLGSDEVVINERLAEALGGDAVGRRFRTAAGQIVTVAAVTRDARLASVERDVPTAFQVGANRPATDRPAVTLTFVVRGGAGIAALEQAADRADPRTRVETRPVAEGLTDQLRPSQVGAVIAGSMGAIAAIVSAIGIFGVVMYFVAARTREIGIRVALGADRLAVIHTLARSTCWALAGGLAIGLAGAGLLVPVLSIYLYGMSPFDPVAFGGAAAILVTATAAAMAVPLRRALRVDPAITLRAE